MRAGKSFSCLGFTVMFAALPLSLFAQAEAAMPLTLEQAREEQAYTIGVQATIYGYPLVEMYRVRPARVSDPANKNRAHLNQFSHGRRLRDPTDTQVVFPNNDTLYSSAFLDLAAEPVILHVPDTNGRYHVFQFMDFYTNNFAHVGKRTTGTKGSDVAVVGPGWKGTLSAGLRRIDSPTNAVWLLGRTLVDGKEDLPAVHALQDRYTLTALSAWGKKEQPAPADARSAPPAYDLSDPLKFFEILNAALSENLPPAREAALMSLFAQVGVGPGKGFTISELDPAVAKGLRRAIEKGRQIITAAPIPGPKPTEGWAAPLPHIGRFGDDFLYRAVVVQSLLAALCPEEAIYFQTYVDDQARRMNGQHRYVLRFEKGQLPPVEAFWSITLYRAPEGLLAANPIDRYSIGDRTKGLRYGPDGSLEITIQQESPGADKESNWLPTPKGEFYLGLRCFLPRQEITAGLWKPPSVKRTK
jgi:hypothetical protein